MRRRSSRLSCRDGACCVCRLSYVHTSCLTWRPPPARLAPATSSAAVRAGRLGSELVPSLFAPFELNLMRGPSRGTCNLRGSLALAPTTLPAWTSPANAQPPRSPSWPCLPASRAECSRPKPAAASAPVTESRPRRTTASGSLWRSWRCHGLIASGAPRGRGGARTRAFDRDTRAPRRPRRHVLEANPDDAGMPLVAKRVGVSERRLRQLFNEHVGVSPKRVARIARIRRTASEPRYCIGGCSACAAEKRLQQDQRLILNAELR